MSAHFCVIQVAGKEIEDFFKLSDIEQDRSEDVSQTCISVSFRFREGLWFKNTCKRAGKQLRILLFTELRRKMPKSW